MREIFSSAINRQYLYESNTQAECELVLNLHNIVLVYITQFGMDKILAVTQKSEKYGTGNRINKYGAIRALTHIFKSYGNGSISGYGCQKFQPLS